VAPFTADELRNLRAPVRAVFGNCDGERAGLARSFRGLGEIREEPFPFLHGGLRFVVCHLEGTAAPFFVARTCDVIVSGHTHRPLVESRDGILLVNPGEASGWLRGKATVALLDPAARTADIVPL
jgi:putative phosphoesterase